MNNENLIKASLIFGGGFLLFMLMKPKLGAAVAASSTNAFDSSKPAPAVSSKDLENAEIVANAYSEALNSGETPARLTELNKECMKEFGMRAYLDKGNQLVVSDTKGNTVLTK
jgi:hypothetical protein